MLTREVAGATYFVIVRHGGGMDVGLGSQRARARPSRLNQEWVRLGGSNYIQPPPILAFVLLAASYAQIVLLSSVGIDVQHDLQL